MRLGIMLLAALCVTSGHAHAAPAALTLERAVAQALARAPEVLAASAEAAAQRARIRQARAAYMPRVDLDVSYLVRWPRNKIDLDTSTIPIPGVNIALPSVDDYHHFIAELSVKYRLLDLARGARIDAARAGSQGADEQAAVTRAQVAFRVRTSFLAALYARDLQGIADAALTQARREAKRAELRSKVGAGNLLSLAQARVRVANLEAQKTRAKLELERRLGEIASLLGLQATPTIEGDLARLDKNVSGSLAGHPALRALTAGERAQRLLAKSMRRGFVPTIGLMASVSAQYPRALMLELGPVVQGGVQLSWSIFDGLLRSGRARQAEAKARALSAQRRATLQNLERELAGAQVRWRKARANLASAKQVLEHNKVYLRVARAARDSGAGTSLDVHNAELNLDRARIAIQRARFDGALARAQMQLIYGIAAGATR
ncbi:MAG: TolC family protein [Myxococcales bacterium]|nr:TolC family protein [Myxococcales bacterium]